MSNSNPDPSSNQDQTTNQETTSQAKPTQANTNQELKPYDYSLEIPMNNQTIFRPLTTTVYDIISYY